MSFDVGQLIRENLLWIILASVALLGCIIFLTVLIKKMCPGKKKPADDGTTYTLFNKQGVQEERVIYADGKIDTLNTVVSGSTQRRKGLRVATQRNLAFELKEHLVLHLLQLLLLKMT